MVKELEEAGMLAREIKKELEKKVEAGMKLSEIADFIESRIKQAGFFPGFPVNLGINEVAAHYTPFFEPLKVPENCLLKIDFGVRTSSGLVVDTAITLDFGEHEDLVLAAKEALEAAEKVLLAKGSEAELWEIGKAIEEAIKERGFEPIRNLSGHSIEAWELHSGLSIPNFDNKSKRRLGSGLFAIEPFATNGKGFVRDAQRSTIYSLISSKPVRLPEARKLLFKIEKEFKTLPFAARWLGKSSKPLLDYLASQGALHNYAVLVEVSSGLVSQFEHTYLVEGKKVIRIS